MRVNCADFVYKAMGELIQVFYHILQEVKIHGTKLRNMTFVHFAKTFLS